MKHAVFAALVCSACANPTPSAIDDSTGHDAAPTGALASSDAQVVLDKADLAGVDLDHVDLGHADLAEPADLGIDDCAPAHGGCSPHATCTQSGTTPSCACKTGYTGDGLSCSAPVTSQLDEGFDDITMLTGWTQQNSSSPLGTEGWYQGNTGNFNSYDGVATSYISANYHDTSDGTISNWLVTPTLTFGALSSVAFYTRKNLPDLHADRIEVRLCTALPCTPPTDTGVGSFTTLLDTVNPNLALGVYPTAWTQLSYDNGTLPWSGQGRVAVRYYVTDSGPDGDNGDVVGIDRFQASAGSAAYAVHGSVTGLSGTVTLWLNGLVEKTMSTSGSFDFGKHLDSGTPYVVTVGTQPSGQTCNVASGSGTIAATDIANVAVTCN